MYSFVRWLSRIRACTTRTSSRECIGLLSAGAHVLVPRVAHTTLERVQERVVFARAEAFSPGGLVPRGLVRMQSDYNGKEKKEVMEKGARGDGRERKRERERTREEEEP